MPRRAAAGVRPLDPDAVYGSKLVQQVINKVMIDGKKSLSEKIVYDALEVLSRRTNKEPVESLEASIKALTPVLEVRSRRVGGATYQVPVEVPSRRARTLAVRWLVQFARARPAKTSADRHRRERRRAAPADRRADGHGDRHEAEDQQREVVLLVAGERARVADLRRRRDGQVRAARDARDLHVRDRRELGHDHQHPGPD